jgi:DNA-binding MurR/RpiR family transcriptional regulator
MQLQDRIEQSIRSLSPNDRRVANRLLSSYPSTAWETVEEVAADIGVSKTAVVRFATRLGYDGFSELQREIQDDVAQLVASPLRLMAQRSDLGGGELVSRMTAQAQANLDATGRLLSTDGLRGLATRIGDCEGTVYVLGARKSSGLAAYAGHLLDVVLPRIQVMRTDGPFPNQLLDLGRNDVLIAITGRRYARVTTDVIHIARENGAYIALLTDSVAAPAMADADAVLVAASEGVSLFDSAVSMVFAVEALVAVIAEVRRPDVTARLKRSEDLLRRLAVHQGSIPR